MRARFIGSSVRGPAHQRDARPCEDAWLVVSDDRGVLAVVADGMGSRPDAAAGSKAATLAARDAWRLWRRSPNADGRDFVRLLEPAWRLRLGETDPSEACSTCLVYAECCGGAALVAQLGDGLIAFAVDEGSRVHGTRADSFGATHALGAPHTLRDWQLSSQPPLGPGERVLLATDGVSEDLKDDRVVDLVDWVVEDIGGDPAPGRRLRSELSAWPVPNHQDDKTLVVVWRE